MRRAPLWAWLVLAWLGAHALLARLPRAAEPGVYASAALARARAERLELDPRRMSARELRTLPGVGETLARAIAEARDAHRGRAALRWDDVPGIGDVRARAIREWALARGLAAEPLAPGRRAEDARYALDVLLPRVTAVLAASLAGCGGERATDASAAGAAAAPAADALEIAARPDAESTPAAAADATVRSRTLALAGGSLHALEAGPVDGPPVLFLHGARYRASTWDELGTLSLLAARGYRAVALDWPGYGESAAWPEVDAPALLASVCAELGPRRPVLVGASLGGGFALEFLAESPQQAAERVAGFVGLAPAVDRDFAPERFDVPTLLVWGERDEGHPLAEARALAGRLSARLEVLEGASHACYLDRPERFHALLVEFLAECHGEFLGETRRLASPVVVAGGAVLYTPRVTAVETPRDEARPGSEAEVERLLAAALSEDVGPGDVTTETLVPEGARARARLVAKADGVLAGRDLVARVVRRLDPALRARGLVEDGARVASGDVVLELEGRARALLVGERTALNLVQRLSGVATLTARFVEAARPARVLDTRKTTPGLRALEKYAVRCGGGENHRSGLFDQAMVKNNHVDLARAGLGALVRELRARRGERLVVTAEARDEREALEAIAADADVVLLDNLSPAALRALCPRLRAAAAGRARPLELEASGGITLENVAEFGASGVDRVSVGALTHSAPALDMSLRISPLP